MEEDNDISVPLPEYSPQPYGNPKDTLIWFDKYNISLMGVSVPPFSIGMSLPSQNVNEKDSNKNN